MKIQYFKQALNILKENPLISMVSILGTALSIAMIMVVVLMYQVKLVGYSPESNRSRMLYVYGTQIEDNEGVARAKGFMSSEVVRECFYTLEIPEAITAISSDSRPISLPDKRLYKEYAIKLTDDSFWKVFDFRFLQGTPFTEADFRSGICKVVISEEVARELFGSVDVVGREIILNFINYRICGVVKSVTEAATDAYAQVWIPYTTDDDLMSAGRLEGMNGSFQVITLAKKESDFDRIRIELENRKVVYNSGKSDYQVQFITGMITNVDKAMGSSGRVLVDWKTFMMDTGKLILFLLLVPAFNLTGVTQSAIQRRRAEMGVRKAFGGTTQKLLNQIIYENLLITLIGGIVGLGLSFVFFSVGKSFLFGDEPTLNTEMLIQPVTFLLALLFVLVLNLLSASIPAYRISRQPIVDTLKEQ